MVLDALDRDAPARGHRGSAAGGLQQLFDRLLAAQFVDCFLAHAAHERHLWTRCGNVEHVSRLQLYVACLVALH